MYWKYCGPNLLSVQTPCINVASLSLLTSKENSICQWLNCSKNRWIFWTPVYFQIMFCLWPICFVYAERKWLPYALILYIKYNFCIGKLYYYETVLRVKDFWFILHFYLTIHSRKLTFVVFVIVFLASLTSSFFMLVCSLIMLSSISF